MAKMRDDIVKLLPRSWKPLKKSEQHHCRRSRPNKKGASEADQLAKAYDNLAKSQMDSAKQLAT